MNVYINELNQNRMLKMGIRVLTILLLISSFIGCGGNKVVSAQIVENEKGQLTNSLLWKISGNGLEEVSYLFGTIHIINESDFFYPNGTLSAMGNTEKVVFEIDMDEMGDMTQAMSMMQKAFMDNGKTLKDLMTPEDYDLVNAHFKRIGLPLFFLERIKPMFLTVFGSGDFSPEDLQSGKIKSYEMEFAKEAKERGLQTGGLESIDFQIGIFDKIPYEDQADMLVESIKSADTGSDQFREMTEIYKRQDINAMQTMMKSDETIEEYEDVLLVQRNQNWIPIMATMMNEMPTFFAVGAGHLGGEMGVIQLLRNEGFILNPVISI